MRKLHYVIALAVVVSLTFAASATPAVSRYQTQQATLTTNALYGMLFYVDTITLNPCDGSFTGVPLGPPTWIASERVNGTLVGSQLSITYIGPSQGSYTYSWAYTGPLSGGIAYESNAGMFPISFTLTDLKDASQWKNHGDYVKSTNGGSDAAHSCLGKPIS